MMETMLKSKRRRAMIDVPNVNVNENRKKKFGTDQPARTTCIPVIEV